MNPEVSRTPVQTPTTPRPCPAAAVRHRVARPGSVVRGREGTGWAEADAEGWMPNSARAREPHVSEAGAAGSHRWAGGRGQTGQADLPPSLFGSGEETVSVGQPRPTGWECFPTQSPLGGGCEGGGGPCFTPSTILQGQRCPHFTDEETEAREGEVGSCSVQGRDSSSGHLTPALSTSRVFASRLSKCAGGFTLLRSYLLTSSWSGAPSKREM